MKKQKINSNLQVFNDPNIAIKVEHLFCVYNENDENAQVSLCDNNVEFEKNKIHFVIGNSGSGKSTLVNHFNGLLKSNYGNIYVQNNYKIGRDLFIQDLLIGVLDISKNELNNHFILPNKKIDSSTFVVAFNHKLPKSIIKIVFEGFYKAKAKKVHFLKTKQLSKVAFYLIKTYHDSFDLEILEKLKWDEIYSKHNPDVLTNIEIFKRKWLAKRKIKKIKNLKKTLGIVFQFPEYQLFKDTILKDVMFGPITLGINKKEAEETSIKYLKSLGIKESFFGRSPFDLSGGQKRRVAISGILAFNPDILVFDEPTAGLDPHGEQEILGIIQNAKDTGKTVLVISHNMDHVLEKADNVVVLNEGEIVKIGKPYEIFTDEKLLQLTSIDKPKVIETIQDLQAINSKFKQLYKYEPRNIDELVNGIVEIEKSY